MNSLSKPLTALESIESKAIVAATIDSYSLGFSRMLFGLFFFAFLSSNVAWIGTVPDAFFAPPLLSIARLFDEFPSERFFRIVDIVILASAFTTTIGLCTRLSTAIWLGGIIVANSFRYSFGKIDHSIMFEAVLFTMLWVDWGQSLSVDELIRRWRNRTHSMHPIRSLHLLTILLAFGFFTAGLPKALQWIDFDFSTNGFLFWLHTGYYNLDRRHLLANAAMQVRPLWVWEFADYSAAIFELGFLVARFHGRAWRWWILIAAIFHLINTVVLNISFLTHIPVYLCFVSWARCFPALLHCLRRQQIAGFVVVSLLCVVCYRADLDVRLGQWFNELAGAESGDCGNLLLATGLWVITLVILATELRRFQPGTAN